MGYCDIIQLPEDCYSLASSPGANRWDISQTINGLMGQIQGLDREVQVLNKEIQGLNSKTVT